MIEALLKIGSELGLAAIIVGAITYLAKLFFTKSAEAAVLNYSSQLQQQLETHKNELELLKVKYQIQFSSLNEKRGEFIALLHGKLYDIQTQLEIYTEIINNKSFFEIGELDKKILDLHKESIGLFEKNRIYLDEELCHLIENNLKDIMSVIANMLLAKSAKTWPSSEVSLDVGQGQLPEEIWQEQNQRVKTDINKSRLELANQFRQIISPQVS